MTYYRYIMGWITHESRPFPSLRFCLSPLADWFSTGHPSYLLGNGLAAEGMDGLEFV